jgi:hypothetical protein
MNWYHQIQHFKNAIVSAILQQNYSFDEANRPPSREFGYAERMNIRLQRSQTRAGIKFAASQEISFQGYLAVYILWCCISFTAAYAFHL